MRRAPAPSTPLSRFRGDVEGLRALAIGIVVLSHAGVPLAPGGYAGVDVFFVISGYLITQLLVGELDRTATVSLPRFYARRIKRLLPQAVTVLVVVAAAAPLLLSPLRAEAAAGDVLASGLYAINWRLSAEAVDYFAAGSADGPLDHFWSLAVEEQFYLVWPVLLVVVTWRWRRRPVIAHRALAAVLGIVAVVSLAYAARLVRLAPDAAYFSTPARAWELAAGGLAALGLADRRLGNRQAAAAAWGGLAAIAAATVALGPGAAYPGPVALLPTLGAVALVAAGTSASPAAPTRGLMLRPVQLVGRLSYAWYVWHWPLLVFAAAVWGPLPAVGGVVVAAVSLVPTVLTHRWIEEPLRRSNAHRRRTRRTLLAAPAGAALAAVLALGVSASIPSLPTLAASEARGAALLSSTRGIQRSARALRPSPRDADRDRSRAYSDGCLVDEQAIRSPRCSYGDPASRTTVVLLGDSHALQYFPPLERIAVRRGWRLVELTKAGCPPQKVRVVNVLLAREYPECDAWREYALRRIDEIERPALVVVTGSARYTVVEGDRRLDRDASTRSLASAYAPTLERLEPAAGEIAVLRDTPRPPRDIPDCVAGATRHLIGCAFPRSEAVADAGVVDAAVRRIDGVRAIDPTSRFCLGRLCPAVIGDVLVYRNSGHVTATYMATLSGWLERRLPPLGDRKGSER